MEFCKYYIYSFECLSNVLFVKNLIILKILPISKIYSDSYFDSIICNSFSVCVCLSFYQARVGYISSQTPQHMIFFKKRKINDFSLMAGLRTTLFMINDIQNILYALKKNSIKNKKGYKVKGRIKKD